MLGWFKRQIRDHFGFSKTETNGVLWLIVLIVLFLAIPQVIQWYYHSNPPASNKDDIALLDSMVTQLEQQAVASSKTINKSVDNPFDVSHKATKRQSQANPTQLIQAFNMNTADISQLQQIKGIGPKLSTRIVKYRDKLGGFVNQAQYQEIYGLDSLVAERLGEHTYIAASFQPQQININTADFKNLISHPYLNYQQVKQIVRYREKHGKLASVQDLLSLGLLEEATFEKIKPYLKVRD
jgi:DNA uptake protein ComE-like DNA-binding protein